VRCAYALIVENLEDLAFFGVVFDGVEFAFFVAEILRPFPRSLLVSEEGREVARRQAKIGCILNIIDSSSVL
jgi:hypothetical protein